MRSLRWRVRMQAKGSNASERKLSPVWIRAANWLGLRGSSYGSCALGAQA